jgi:hypothetical protein
MLLRALDKSDLTLHYGHEIVDRQIEHDKLLDLKDNLENDLNPYNQKFYMKNHTMKIQPNRMNPYNPIHYG